MTQDSATHGHGHQNAEPGAEPVTFASLGLSDRALAAIKRIGFEKPSDIQTLFIPAALTGKDCIGQARTGTGKTAAFLLPIFEHFFRGEKIRALILAPTRELAVQIGGECDKLSGTLPPRATCVYGGQPIRKQITHLQSDPDIVVATPGRIIDHHKRGSISFNRFSILVLDEVDRMFDMGFRQDILYIINHCANRKQTLFLSATLPNDIVRLAEKSMKDPLKVNAISEGSPSVATLDHRYFPVSHERKMELLLKVLERESPKLGLIFTRTKIRADKLSRALKDKGFLVRCIHGDLPQEKRERALVEFRSGKINLLVATDVMGRGIDVPGVSHVFNYDLPENAEDYLHRTGRSARMNAPGTAISFVTPDDADYLTGIEMLCNRLIEQDCIPDFDIGSMQRSPRKPQQGGRRGGGGGGRGGHGGHGGHGGRPGGGRPHGGGGQRHGR